MDNTIDFVYQSLQNDIIYSYTHGGFDNKLGQLKISLYVLEKMYDPEKFQNIFDSFHTEREKLLTAVQTEVDRISGTTEGFKIMTS